MAAKAGAALVPGLGFDYAPGDMIAALTAERMGALEEIAIAYSVRSFAPTQGTALSALEIMRGVDVYGLTAASLAQGAMLCAEPAYDRSGALAPTQAFDPASFLAALGDFLSYEVEPLPAPAAA